MEKQMKNFFLESINLTESRLYIIGCSLTKLDRSENKMANIEGQSLT